MEICSVICIICIYLIHYPNFGFSASLGQNLFIQPELINVRPGERIQANCTSNSSAPHNLTWEAKGHGQSVPVSQKRVSGSTQLLIIDHAKPQDAGNYDCVMTNGHGSISKILQIHIDAIGSVTTEPFSKDSSKDDDQMMWLKTTVYTVIACTIGIVLLISVVVIAIFRIKMKRAAVRRAIRHAERRHRHSNRCESHGNGSSRARRNYVTEHEPFISAPSPTHFGNIIVNVNNGVQYMPSTEFVAEIQVPPSYSEVVAASTVHYVGRNSPPPEYSTIDRNPREMDVSDLENNRQECIEDALEACEHSVRNISIDNNDMHLCDGRDQDTNENFIECGASSSPSSGHWSVVETSSLGRRNCHGQGSRRSRNCRAVGPPRRPKQLQVRGGQIVLDDSSNSLETVNINTQTNPLDLMPTNQNVTSHINLTPANQNVVNPIDLSPTNRNVASHIDVTPTNQNVAKPCQLKVHGGQIVLDSQGDSSSADLNSTATDSAVSAQGQLVVKDGQIVFKTSET